MQRRRPVPVAAALLRESVRSPVRKLLLGCALAAAAAMTARATPTLVGTERRVTTALADQFDPAISGDIVIYTDFSGVDADVWYTDLATGVARPVSMAAGDQQLTAVSGHRIAFSDWNTMDVIVFDITTATSHNLTNDAGSNALDPALGGDLIAWTDDRDHNPEIYARDLATGEERRISNHPYIDEAPAVGDGLIAWERCDGYACDILVYDWLTGQTRQLTATPQASERFPDVFGRVVVFQREQGTPIDKDIVAINLDQPGERVLSLAGDQENAHISGDVVAFNDAQSGTPHIGLWRLATDDHFTIDLPASGQYLVDIDANHVVYSDNRAGTLDIWMYTFNFEPSPADVVPPVIRGAADVTVDATTSLGALVPFAVSATDDEDPTPALSCSPPSGAMFPVGTTRVDCTATDASGNRTTAAFQVAVRGADSQIAALADLVTSLNLRQGIENSLDRKLAAAVASLEAARAGAIGTACNQLGAFAAEVNAQAGKAITAQDAATLLAMVARIRVVLGCG
jgi:beta propeller repeat protein